MNRYDNSSASHSGGHGDAAATDPRCASSRLATADDETRAQLPRIEQRHIDALKRDIDGVNDLPALRSFVLAGGGWASAYFHLARTVCRPCERIVVALAATEDVGDLAVQ